jgi:hypothetical protein
MARPWAGVVPIVVKLPATKSEGPAPSSKTSSDEIPLFALPTALQAVPFHAAKLVTAVVPAIVNLPAAWSAGPLPLSNA